MTFCSKGNNNFCINLVTFRFTFSIHIWSWVRQGLSVVRRWSNGGPAGVRRGSVGGPLGVCWGSVGGPSGFVRVPRGPSGSLGVSRGSVGVPFGEGLLGSVGIRWVSEGGSKVVHWGSVGDLSGTNRPPNGPREDPHNRP